MAFGSQLCYYYCQSQVELCSVIYVFWDKYFEKLNPCMEPDHNLGNVQSWAIVLVSPPTSDLSKVTEILSDYILSIPVRV